MRLVEHTHWCSGLCDGGGIHRRDLGDTADIVQLAPLRAHRDFNLRGLAGRVGGGLHILPDAGGLAVLHMDALPALLERLPGVPELLAAVTCSVGDSGLQGVEAHGLVAAGAARHPVAVGVALDVLLVGGGDARVAAVGHALVLALVAPLHATAGALELLPGEVLRRLLLHHGGYRLAG